MHTGLVVVFFLMCFQAQLLFDLRHGYWLRLVKPLAIIAGISLAVGWLLGKRLDLSAPSANSLYFLCYLAIILLFFPLVSQFPFLGRSVVAVGTPLITKTTTTTENLLTAVKQFPGAYESYVKENFNLPQWFVQLNAMVKVYVFGVSPNDNIALGKDGFYFEGMGTSRVEKEIVERFDNIADYMGQAQFTEDQLLQWKMALEQRRYWLQQQGSEYVFVLAPTKAFVYPEYLPSNLRKARGQGGQTRYEQLSRYLRAYADVPFVDLLPPLLEAKARTAYPLLFYKTDFHWNYYGAFFAYKAIVKELERLFPHYFIRSPELADFEIKINDHWIHERFMYMLGLPLSLHKNEHHITIVPRPGGLYDTAKDLPAEGIYDSYPKNRKITAADGKTMEARLLLNPAAPIPSIALLGDSFLEKCIYFFCANAQRVLNFRTVINFPKEIFHYEQPTIVIQEILNMFILRPPPENPANLTEPYFKKKFEDHPDKVIFLQTFSNRADANANVQGTHAPQVFPLLGIPERREGEVQVLSISFDSATEEDLTLYLLDEQSKEVATRSCRVQGKAPTCFVGLPPNKIMSIQLVSPKGSAATAVVNAIEVRSDTTGP